MLSLALVMFTDLGFVRLRMNSVTLSMKKLSLYSMLPLNVSDDESNPSARPFELKKC